jgi:hypothetical protein
MWWYLPIGDFLECLYAITYKDISSNYPKNCPQEMGIKEGYWSIEKSGKTAILSIF